MDAQNCVCCRDLEVVVGVLESFGNEAPTQLHTPAAIALRDLLQQAHSKLQGYSKRQNWLQKAQPWKLDEERVRFCHPVPQLNQTCGHYLGR